MRDLPLPLPEYQCYAPQPVCTVCGLTVEALLHLLHRLKQLPITHCCAALPWHKLALNDHSNARNGKYQIRPSPTFMAVGLHLYIKFIFHKNLDKC